MKEISSDDIKKTYNNFLRQDLRKFPEYYVSRDDQYSSLFTTFDLSDKSHKILFGGHRGSGKSTELYRIKDKLEENPEFSIIFISILDEGTKYDFTDLFFTDIVLLILIKLLDKVQQENFELDSDSSVQLGTLLQELGHGSYSSLYDLLIAKLSANLGEKKGFRDKSLAIRYHILELINRIALNFESAKNVKLILIVDDIEKVTEFENVRTFFIEHDDIFTNLEIHSIFTIPPLLNYAEGYTPTRTGFNNFCVPLFQTRDINGQIIDGQIKRLIEIASKRITDKKIFEECSLRMAALCSGGIVDDFLKLCAQTIAEAKIKNEFPITEDVTKRAFRHIRQAYTGIPNLHIRLWSEVHHLHQYPGDNADKGFTADKFRLLLYTTTVLEYRNEDGSIWYDIHPTLFSESELDQLTDFICDHNIVN